LGHASIETTHGYVEIDLEMKRKTLRSCEKLLPNNCFPELLKHQTAEERLATIAIAKAAWRRSRQAAQLGIASVLAPGNPARSSPSGAATPPAALSRRPQLPSTKSRSTIAPTCPSHLILGYPPDSQIISGLTHPVINAGVQIAAWHHYRLPEDLLSI
jgi:hypothetical protein